MGDSIHSSRNADFQSSHRRDPASLLQHSHSNGSGPANGEEEPYTIKCICAFPDDTYDGNTVFCDRCNTWQHIACYYFPSSTLEDDFEHNCVDCNPSQRPKLDVTQAKNRQRNLRHPQDPNDDRKGKRPGAKSHKKTKTRDANGIAPQTNGWPKGDAQGNEVREESPRDQGPPYKRPKTSHRYSSSTNNHPRPADGRNRSGSHAAQISQDQIRLPLKDCPPDFLSPDFIRVHHENTQFHLAQANLHLNIEITDLLSNWLDDQESFYQATNGKNHNEVFQRFPQPIEELEQPIQKHTRVDTDVKFHGEHPAWPYLTVEADLVAGDYVGELRGSIGRTDEYVQDETNQWAKLRHPDHFVFFHPVLPIYIDSRSEGTELRYARRSCRPNLKMETIITGSREYRFCFTASDDIPRNTEITIPWDTKCDSQLYQILAKAHTAMSESDIQHVSQWVGNLLAHFGGCACEQQTGSGPCLLAHFDRRLSHLRTEAITRSTKSRKRSQANKLSPSAAVKPNNSRASSGGPSHTDVDDDVDMEDNRSPTRSTDNKSSRGTTPSHVPKDEFVTDTGELSGREKRKLMQSERLFERLSKDQGSKSAGQPPGQKKKKRSSGSNVNTPTAATQKSIGLANDDPDPQTSHTRINGQHEHGAAGAASKPIRPVAATFKRPVYVDASMQTDPEKPKPVPVQPNWPNRMPRSHLLLKKSLMQRRRLPRPVEQVAEGEKQVPTTSPSTPIEAVPYQTPAFPVVNAEGKHESNDDHEAQDEPVPLEVPSTVVPTEPIAELQSTKEPSQSPLKPAHPPIKPPPPPWTMPIPPKSTVQSERSPKGEPNAPLVLDLSSTAFSNSSVLTESPVATPAAHNTGVVVSSPEARRASGGSPAGPLPNDDFLTAKASPVKKKMTLTEYMRKRQPETPALQRTQSQGQPVMPGGTHADMLKKKMSEPSSTQGR